MMKNDLVDPLHFTALSEQDPADVCRRTGCTYDAAEKTYTLTVWGNDYDGDIQGFTRRCDQEGGTKLDLADAACPFSRLCSQIMAEQNEHTALSAGRQMALNRGIWCFRSGMSASVQHKENHVFLRGFTYAF
jgi:hypothetical protein